MRNIYNHNTTSGYNGVKVYPERFFVLTIIYPAGLIVAQRAEYVLFRFIVPGAAV